MRVPAVVVRVVGALVLAAALSACGDDGGASTSSGGQAAELADRAGLDAGAVVGAICASWERGQPDHPTVNQYVHDLLLARDLVGSGARPGYDEDDIDRAVDQACAAHRGDPEAFVRSVRDALGLSEADLQSRIDGACARDDRQRAADATGEGSGEDLSQLLRDLAAARGADLAKLRAAITGICGGP